MRLGIAQIPGAIYWDVNQVRSKPALALAGAQYTNYVVSDATHSTMAGAVAEAYALWNRVLSKLLPVRASILPSSDDVYHATLNPYGWMTNATAASSNFRLSGSAAAAATGTSGFKPTNTTFDRLAGDGTAVGSKLTASDGNTSDGSDTLEDAARIVLTPVSTDTTMQLRFGTFLHGLSVGTWVEGMAYVDIKGAPDFFKGVPFQVKDITNAGSVTNFTSTGLAAYDPGSSGHVTGQRSLPNKNMCGTIWSPPFQVIGDAFSLNIPISYWGGASGTGQVDALFLGVRPIPDPTVVF
jgi:hypothetical protein